jgi:hypothetical protein
MVTGNVDAEKQLVWVLVPRMLSIAFPALNQFIVILPVPWPLLTNPAVEGVMVQV